MSGRIDALLADYEPTTLDWTQRQWLLGILDAMNQELEDRERERRTRSKVVAVRHGIIPLTRHLPLLGLV